MPDMYAAIFAAGALGYGLNLLFLMIERRVQFTGPVSKHHDQNEQTFNIHRKTASELAALEIKARKDITAR